MKTILLSLLATNGTLSAQDLTGMSPSEGAVPLFDGRTLDGWKTSEFDKKFWWTKDGWTDQEVIKGRGKKKRAPKTKKN